MTIEKGKTQNRFHSIASESNITLLTISKNHRNKLIDEPDQIKQEHTTVTHTFV